MARFNWGKGIPWVLLAIGFFLYGSERQRAGRLAGEVATLTTQRNALLRRAPLVRQEFVRDTVLVTKRITKYETLRDSIFRTDTLHARDTVFIRVVASADSTIKACCEVVSSCSKSLALADSIHSVDQQIIKAFERSRPSFLRRWGERVAWSAGGYVVGRALR